MLKELFIENLAIIDKLDIELGDGLITLTGETGAGKSIILSGINLLLGEKASLDMLRTNEKSLVAQGVFNVNEEQKKELLDQGIEIEEDEVIIRRVFDDGGKNKIFINGARVPMGTLKEVMKSLVDIVGQHSHQMLLNKENHIKLLDKFSDEESKNIRINIEKFLNEYNELENKINEIENNKKDLAERRELYQFQLEEIENADLGLDEEEELDNEYKKLFNAGKIKEKLSISEAGLKYEEVNILSMLYACKKNIESIVDYGKDFEEVYEQIEKVYYELEDCASSIESLNENIDIDERRLSEVIERLDLIKKLEKKYGSSIKEILDYKDKIKGILNNLEDNDFQISKYLKAREEARENYWVSAIKLREIRKKYIAIIEKELVRELEFLNMKNVKIDIKLEEKETMTKNGSDNIEFFIATNIGQEPKPLQKIASGGEVSRIMLALKVIFSKVDNIPILIFDEIDTGVGGETVRKIADKLKEIGGNAQVLCITHSPAIASKAREQFFIEKKVIESMTITTVKKLSEDERVFEIARMLAGQNITESVINHARELLLEE